MAKRQQLGFDNRHRDIDGEIHLKRSDTLVGTFRKGCPDFAPGTGSDMKFGNYLKRDGFDRLSDALKK